MKKPVDVKVVSGLDFTIEIDAMHHLAVDANQVTALVTVTARPAGPATPTARLAEVLIMDRSLSMQDQNKIHAARRAACAAIDALPDGVLLGIIAGNEQAVPIFPAAGGLAVTDAQVRADAKSQVKDLRAKGGTKIGQWLIAAAEAFSSTSAAGVIRHAVLYTDGKNQHETRQELDEALARCADQFTCDARGLGEDWDYHEVSHIANKLHGKADAVVDVADLPANFTDLIRRARRLALPRTYLRLRPNERFTVVEVKRTYPDQADLVASQRTADDAAVEVSLGPWAAEQATQRYQLSLRFDPAAVPVGEKLRAVRLDLLAELPDGTRKSLADAPLEVIRNDTPQTSAILPESLTRVHRERDLTHVIQVCVDAKLRGHDAEADEHLRKALRMARALDDERLPLLEDIAVADPDGRVGLRPDIRRGDLNKVGLRSTMTTFKPPGGLPGDGGRGEAPGWPATGRACAECQEPADDGDSYCQSCGGSLDRGATP